MLRYGQDSITVMSAYAAVFLLKLLNSSNTSSGLPEGAAHEVHELISKTADAYFDASLNSPSTSAVFHARFLRNLVNNDVFKAREKCQPERLSADPRLQSHSPPSQSSQVQDSPPQMYPQAMVQAHEHPFRFPASPHLPPLPDLPQDDFPPSVQSREGGVPMNYQFPVNGNTLNSNPSELDAHYWRNIFLELGFGGGIDQSAASQNSSYNYLRTVYPDSQNLSSQHIPYHQMPSTQTGYGH
jgi:hypothetical protein